ncbi:MAG: hypothetical protein P4L79_10840 [Legionella sp.]|uniref:hypothetical protein n=1 Tax=Legionella sp. TaxID=459 RepID=UPI002841869A|nr:hypothetical protein [Legionella sp.]
MEEEYLVSGVKKTREFVEQCLDEYSVLYPDDENVFATILDTADQLEDDGGIAVFLFDKSSNSIYVVDESQVVSKGRL